MSVNRLVWAAESVARGLRSLVAREEAPGSSRAKLFCKWADVLEVAARSLSSPEDATPPGGTWIGDVVTLPSGTWPTPVAVRFALRRLGEARTLLRLASSAVSFAGDLDTAGAIERWIERVDAGPQGEDQPKPE